MRYIAHNGEINTLRGNLNLMKAREGVMASSALGPDLASLYPVVEADLSDSGSLDCSIEFLMQAGGRSGFPKSLGDICLTFGSQISA